MAIDSPATPEHVGLEIREGRPWWKVCCVGCLVVVVGIIMLIGFAWRGLSGGGPRSLKALPQNFPAVVNLYRIEDAVSIVYLPGSEKNRLMAFVMAPFRMFGRVMISDHQVDQDEGVGSTVSQLQNIDTVTVRWERFAAERATVLNRYLDDFRRNGFRIDILRDDATATDTVIASREDVRVQLQIQDLADVAGVDSIVVVTDYLNQ
ncbi:hypothetical protein KJ925_04410 [Patescibacteria group bacterium]|nr:hypothetical protein [Patescibacteria group bacterium]